MPRTVLIVEDEPEIREVVKMVVEELLGYQSVQAATGEEALERVAEAPPDLVVLDLLLPGIDGFTVASRLRSTPGLNGMKILALSGLTQQESLARAKAAGCDTVLAKPFDVDDLIGKIEELIGSPVGNE